MTIAGGIPGGADRLTRTTRWQIIILSVATLLLYGRTIGFDFVWDDGAVIVNNPYLRSWRTLAELLLTEDRASELNTGYYRPVTYFSFLLDRTFWGDHPFGFHLTNILLHSAVVITLYTTLRTMIGGWTPFAAALLFALHPLNAETVSFLSGGRNTLLAALFGLLAILCHIRCQRFAAILFFALSISSKETAILLPILLFCHDRWLTGRPVKYGDYLPYVVAGAGYFALRAYVLDGMGISLRPEGLAGRLLFTPHLLFGYLRNLIWPVSLRIPYDLSPPVSLDGVTMLVAVGLAVIAILIFRSRKQPVALFSLWFVLFLAPVLNIIPLGGIAMADRYAYFSAMGGITALAICCERFAGRWKNALVAICAICYLPVSFVQSSAWESNRTLFARMVSDAPAMSTGYYNKGLGLYDDGDTLAARSLLEQALAAPHKLEAEQILMLLAMINWELGDKERAKRVFISLSSRQQNDPRIMAIFARFFDDIGARGERDMLLSRAGLNETEYARILREYAVRPLHAAERHRAALETDAAARLYHRALLLDPGSLEGLLGLGGIASLRGNLPMAINYYERAASIYPSNPLPWQKLADANLKSGRSAEAATAMDRYKSLSK